MIQHDVANACFIIQLKIVDAKRVVIIDLVNLDSDIVEHRCCTIHGDGELAGVSGGHQGQRTHGSRQCHKYFFHKQ